LAVVATAPQDEQVFLQRLTDWAFRCDGMVLRN